jgi:hypothetical protein
LTQPTWEVAQGTHADATQPGGMVAAMDTAIRRPLDRCAEVMDEHARAPSRRRVRLGKDPLGHRWNISQHLREVPQEYVIAAATRAFS